MYRKSLSLFFFYILIFNNLACESNDGFDFLQSGNGTNDIDELVIAEYVPDSANVIIEKQQSVEFFLSTQSPIGRVVSYSWYLDSDLIRTGLNQRLTFTGDDSNLGNHELKVIADDGYTREQKVWSVKVNGPPVLSPVTTGTPKVSVGSSITIEATAVDPNSDMLQYDWKINGVNSAFLTSVDGVATLTGDLSLVGSINVSVTVSDGTKEDSYIWTAEVNHFPMACNQLQQGEICTYAGNPSIGEGIDPLLSSIPLRINPIAQTQDSLGNIFIADYDSSVIWYWNRTNNDVSRLGLTIAANTIKVVAGTGEIASGLDGIALQSALNRPRGIAYRESSGVLYISEWNGHRIRYIDNTGFIFTGFGAGTSQVDGDIGYNHDCNNPSGLYLYNDNLYIACRSHNKVKRWDLNTDLGYTVCGDGGADFSGMGGVATAAGCRRPARVFVDADGVYITHREDSRVSFVNHSGVAKTFWGATVPIVIADGDANIIMGTGGAGSPTSELNPQSAAIGNFAGIVVKNDLIFVTQVGNDDNLYLANNTGAPVTISTRTVNPGKILYLNHTTAGYNGSGLAISEARMSDPYDLSIDILDNNKILLSSLNNRRIREIDLTNEVINDVVGSGNDRFGFYGDTSKPTMSHLFYYPTGIAYDSTNRKLFFTDANNYRIRQVDAYGNIETALGRGNGDTTVENDIPTNAYLRTAYSANLNRMNGLALLSDLSLIQANTRGHHLRLWNRSSTNQSYFSVFIQSDRVSTIAGDPLGYTNGVGNAVDGASALSNAFDHPNSVAVYNDAGTDRVWIADSINHCIRELNSDGTLSNQLGNCGVSGDSASHVAEATVELNTPIGLAVDPANGNIIFSDSVNNKIRYWNRSINPVTIGLVTIQPGFVGVIACNSGGTGSTNENIYATTSRCTRPSGVTVNENYICYANQDRHNVRCINKSDGKINTVAGFPESTARGGSPFGFEQEGVQATTATLYSPSAISFDENGDLFICDTNNHIVRKVKLSP